MPQLISLKDTEKRTVSTGLRRALLLEDPDGSSYDSCPLITLDITDKNQEVRYLGDAAVCIGAFDGIHEGHRYLIDQMREDAAIRGIPSIIITFDPDPDELFKKCNDVRKLLSNKDRLAFLRKCGADYLLSISFTRELACLDHKEFFDHVISRVCSPKSVHVGSDFRLGACGEGNLPTINTWCLQHGCRLFGYNLLRADGGPISATRVRNLLAEGQVERAAEIMGRWHFIRGEVVAGRGVGTGFGFPTANVQVTYPYQIPQEGVYAGYVIVDGIAWPTATSIGLPPTFEGEEGLARLEANLLGFSGDLYEKKVEIILTERLREMRRFESTEELIQTVMGNIEYVKKHYGQEGIEVN